MRFRVKRGGPAAGFTFDRTAKPVQRPEPEKPVSLAQALDNPYGRYYGKARSREELLKNRYYANRTPPVAFGDSPLGDGALGRAGNFSALSAAPSLRELANPQGFD